jgi:hypothetical protein
MAEFKLIDKESSLWGWSRIIAALTALGSFGAILIAQPDQVPSLSEVANHGTEVIDAFYLLIAKLGLLITACLTVWSKIQPFMPWVKK